MPPTDDELTEILTIWANATPGPVAPILLPADWDPVEWFRDCLSKNIREEVYGVGVGTPDEIEGQSAPITALTGNGPRSQANADFYVMCHTAIPVLVDEIRRLRRKVPHEGFRASPMRYRHG